MKLIVQTTDEPTRRGQWWVYLVLCHDGSFYCGTTQDLVRRLLQHTNGEGSQFLRRKNKKPFEMFSIRAFDDIHSARHFERWLKTRSRDIKAEYLMRFGRMIR
jgi:putative endonuclease